MTDYDLIVIGLGGIGSATAYWAARSGLRVLGLERFELGHDRGASHDHSRIIRYSYHTRSYVELATRAYDAWAEVERDSGEQVVFRTGGLDLFPHDCAIAPGDYRDALDTAGIEYEWLASAAIRERWPQFAIDEQTCGLYQRDGGIAAAALANATHQRLARRHGAELLEHVTVDRLDESATGSTVHAAGTRYRARSVVIAADAWTNELLSSFDAQLPFTVLREQVTYFNLLTRLAAFEPARLPVWIWMDEPSFYGFPTFGEPDTIKVAQDCGGRVTTAGSRTFDCDDGELARVEAFTRGLFGRSVGAPRFTKTCLYTLTPDRDFVLDRVPGCAHTWVAQGAAHGFKFVSALGRLLVQCTTEGDCDFDRTPFLCSRPALTDPTYEPNWMV